jgi:hypothetical protein
MPEILITWILFMLSSELKKVKKNKVKIKIYWQKVKFRVIVNSVQFIEACKVSSPTDAINENRNRKDFLKKISKYFVFICS